MLTQEKLKESLDYSVITGEFIRRTNSGTAKAGDTAGCVDSLGYIQISVNGEQYRAHRLAAFYVLGYMPIEVDHINRDRQCNPWINLRLTDRAGNGKNLPLSKKNKTGVCGVSWDNNREMWRARITANGKDIHLGYFSEKKEAIKARQEANNNYGFHSNHGKTV